MNNITLQALARLIVAKKAYEHGEVKFAGEVLAGAWDHTNRTDIAEVLTTLSKKPITVSAMLDSVTKP